MHEGLVAHGIKVDPNYSDSDLPSSPFGIGADDPVNSGYAP